jgi:hypothetical protein
VAGSTVSEKSHEHFLNHAIWGNCLCSFQNFVLDGTRFKFRFGEFVVLDGDFVQLLDEILFKGGEDEDCTAIGTSSACSSDSMDVNVSANRSTDLDDFGYARVINTAGSAGGLARAGKAGRVGNTRRQW